MPGLVRELNPAVQLAAARATWERTGDLRAAFSQMAADIVLGAAEHVQGFGIVTCNYRITAKGLASEVTIRNVDGYATTLTFLLRDLLFPSKERQANNPNYRPVGGEQASHQLQAEKLLSTDPSVNSAIIMSLGHQEGSDRNWMYLFMRDAKDPTLVRLIAIRLPDDRSEALDFRDRMLAAAGLHEKIPLGDRMGMVVLRAGEGGITPKSVAAAAQSTALFGFDAKELAELSADGFEVIQQRQADEIEALARNMLREVYEAECETIDDELNLGMRVAGRYLFNMAQQARQEEEMSESVSKPAAGGGAGDINTALENAGLELTSQVASDSDGIELAEGAELGKSDLTSSDVNLAADDLTDSTAELESLKLDSSADQIEKVETESGDESLEPITSSYDISNNLDVKEDAQEEEAGSIAEAAQLELVLEDSIENAAEKAEREEAAQDAAFELAEKLDDQARIRELIEELGGDISILSNEPADVSALGVLLSDGEIPALTELGDLQEVLLAAEVTDGIYTDDDLEFGDNGDDVSASGFAADKSAVESGNSNDAEGSQDEILGEALGLSFALIKESETEAAANGIDTDVVNDVSKNSLSVDGLLGQEVLAADTAEGADVTRDTDSLNLLGRENLDQENDDIEEAAPSASALSLAKRSRANRRRSAMRALNRLRFQAESVGVDVFELMKIRQRRGLKRLWFEQLVFALARELNFNFEQRQMLARELELSSADFDDIRQAELAVRRELHARKIRARLLDVVQNQ